MTKEGHRFAGRVRCFRGDDRAVSETIGALLLILIVFAAASSLAIFVQAKQKEFQEQKSFEQDRGLERFGVLRIDPVLNKTTGDSWKEVNFTVSSLHVKDSFLSGFYVNGESLRSWTLWRHNGTSGQVEKEVHVDENELKVLARERFALHVNLSTDGHVPIDATTSSRLELEVTTWLGNRFARAFLPPSAVGLIHTEMVRNATTGNYTPVLVLDGTPSEALEGASLVSWEWTVEKAPAQDVTLHGRKVRADLTQMNMTHQITLTVVDDFGMRDSVTFAYFY